MKFFDGCTALITGASSGLGEEFAWQLAPHADTLILAARRGDRLEDLSRRLASRFPGVTVLPYTVDLADDSQIRGFTKWLDEKGVRVNFLINNAGLGDHGPFETSDWKKTRQVIEVNVVALTRLTHRLLPTLRQAGRAAILNVSSIASLVPIPDLAVYAATKAYVTSFSESLRVELHQTGVTVTAVCPGPVRTEFFRSASRQQGEGEVQPDSPRLMVVPAAEVVRKALEAVAADRARVIPGVAVCVAMSLATLLPLCLLRLVLQRTRGRFH